MMILDLHTEFDPIWNKTNNFFGKPWIWNMLHEFGGTMGLFGKMQIIMIDPFDAFKKSDKTMIGKIFFKINIFFF